MIHTVRLIVITDSGREIHSNVGEMTDSELQDYENKVKWGTMNTMEPFVMTDAHGNQVCIRPEKIESTVVQKVESRDEKPLASLADEAVARGTDKIVARGHFKIRPTSQPEVQEESGSGKGGPQEPVSNFRVVNLRNAFRPPAPKVRARVQTSEGSMDRTVEIDLGRIGFSRPISERAEEATQPIPKISENDNEPVLAGQKGDK